ncbi:MAG: hypothetical protein GYA24_14390 [Candidatus Lokiarchaeota archaeon]|nr:hypothetical protein [Candidatus Lokiarchaeota archaeon]
MNGDPSRAGGAASPGMSTRLVIVLGLVALIVLPVLHFLPTAMRLSGPLYEKRVLAFYYTWYGNTTVYPGENPGSAPWWWHWGEGGHDPGADPMDIGAAQHPTLNTSDIVLFDSGDPAAMRFHLDCATYAGIDSFICTWWGINDTHDYNLRTLLDVTNSSGYDMQHTVYFETVQDQFKHDNPACVTNLFNKMKYIIQSYGSHPKFLRVDGRPVIFVYATTAKPSMANWSSVVDLLHANGMNPFLIADLGGPRAVPADWLQVFDGFHVYNPLGLYRDEPQNALPSFESLVLSSRANGKLACVTTLPGYNDTQVRSGVEPLRRQGGAIYRQSWTVAKQADPDWALICTFNEWHEGTEIEPSLENGTYYIDVTRDYVSEFMA